MYVVKYISDIVKEGLDNYKDYKLCYVDEISKTIFDYDENSKKLMNSKNFTYLNYGHLLVYKDYPNPLFIENKQELFAYFTPINLDDQWGDDWNDSPYEHNSGIPYDSYKENEITIIKVPFYFRDACYPDSNFLNSPFSVQDINRGRVSWIFLNNENNYDSIYGGDSLEKFIKLYLIWNEL